MERRPPVSDQARLSIARVGDDRSSCAISAGNGDVCPNPAEEAAQEAGQEAIPLELQATVDLLARARAGDEVAWEVVYRRCVRGLRRFAVGRLPRQARGMNDTEDLVQDTVMSALRRLDQFEIRHEGALLAYLRQAILNRVIDEVRKVNRRPMAVSLPVDYADSATSPLELVIGRQNVERYEAALTRLKPRDRETIMLRLEQQVSYDEMAVRLGMPTGNAARVAVKRALVRLAEEMARCRDR